MTPSSLLCASIAIDPSLKPRLLDKRFTRQTEFILHPARRKALFCTRRSAKSYTGGLYLVKEALEHDNSNCLYLGLTRLSAKGIIWKDILKTIDKKNHLGMTFNGTELTATTTNSSVIYATGVDADEDEMEKLLGKKYRLIIIDEAASYTVDLRRLVYGILGPSVVDQGGTICLLGTSGDLTQGLFYDITTGAEPGWTLFQWTAHDNPYVAKQWQEELDDIRQNRPLFMDTPLFKQWYLNLWVVDTEKLVYRFSAQKNIFQALPHHHGNWNYVLGVDLGYSPDPSAFVLCAFHDHDPHLYLLETFKKTEMDITDVANRIKLYQSRFDIFKVVIDGANKQAVEEIQKRHGIALTTADKAGKSDFIQIMNAEFIQEKIKLSSSCSDLIEEYAKLIWQLDGEKIDLPRKENPNCSNHLTDAALYAWRFCYQFLSAAPAPKIDPRRQWRELSQRMAEDNIDRDAKRQQEEERNEISMDTAMLDNDQDVAKYFINRRR